jgi:hypothetical protein
MDSTWMREQLRDERLTTKYNMFVPTHGSRAVAQELMNSLGLRSTYDATVNQ